MIYIVFILILALVAFCACFMLVCGGIRDLAEAEEKHCAADLYDAISDVLIMDCEKNTSPPVGLNQ